MKARIENGKIKMYGELPLDFQNVLNFRNASEDIHQEHGFFNVVTPEYDPAYWRLGEIYFDSEDQVFTYELVEIPIEEIVKSLHEDFQAAKDRTRKELLDALVDKMIELHRNELPGEMVQLWDSIKAENERVPTTIEELAENDPDALRKFRIRNEDVQEFVSQIRKFKM